MAEGRNLIAGVAPWLGGTGRNPMDRQGMLTPPPKNTLYDSSPGLVSVSDPLTFVDPDAWLDEDDNPNWVALSAPFIAAGLAKLTGRDAAKSFNNFVQLGRGIMAGEEAVMKRKLAQRNAAIKHGVDLSQERREWTKLNHEMNKELGEKLLSQVESVARVNQKGASKILQGYYKRILNTELSDDMASALVANIVSDQQKDAFIKKYDALDSDLERMSLILSDEKNNIFGFDDRSFQRITAAVVADEEESYASIAESRAKLEEAKVKALKAGKEREFLESPQGRRYVQMQFAQKQAELEVQKLKTDYEKENWTKDQQVKKLQNAIFRNGMLTGMMGQGGTPQSMAVAAGQTPGASKIFDAANVQFTGDTSQNTSAINGMISELVGMGLTDKDSALTSLVMSWYEIQRTTPELLELKDGGALRLQDVFPGLAIPDHVFKRAQKEMGIGGDKTFDTAQDVAMDVKKTVDQALLDRHPERMARMSSGEANSEDRAVLAQERNNIITAIINKQKWGDAQKSNVIKWLDEAYKEKQQATQPQEVQKTQQEASPLITASQDQTRAQGPTKRMSSFPESIPSERIPKPPLRPQNSNSPDVEMKSPEFVTKDDGSTTAMMRARNGRIATEFMSDFIQGKKTSEEDIKDFLKAINSGVVDIKSIDEGLLQRFMDAYNKGN